MHAPVLVNTLGHCAGAIVFGILLYYLLLDWRRDRAAKSLLPCVAAGLALLWNLGSLIGLATIAGDPVADAIVAASFSVLSLLPAVLLRISLGSSRRTIALIGYTISAIAIALHLADLITDAARFHYAAILLVTLGFGTLSAFVLIRELAAHEEHGSGKPLAGAMVLFLLAISFAHFRSGHDTGGWSGEAALHHAAIPLALFVLLQDYRFVLADAFLRFLTSAILAAITIWTAWAVQTRLALYPGIAASPVYTGLLFVGSCILISVFAWAQTRLQKLLTRVVFLRQSAADAISGLREAAWATESPATFNEYARATDAFDPCDRSGACSWTIGGAGLAPARASEEQILEQALDSIRTAFSADRAALPAETTPRLATLGHAIPVADSARYGCPPWVRAIAPLRLSRGDVRFFFLGPRAGGRRYLSEDVDLLDQMAAVVCERLERARHAEMQALVSQAELRALQAQINPHFFFNALNTLYGVIPRENPTARRLVLNLAELFRVSFASERTSIRIEEEVRIVRAYLEIDQLRLGDKLKTEISVDDDALQFEVPVLSIQPLVENAVKHGVASRATGGFVHLSIRRQQDEVLVEVTNSGAFQPAPDKTGASHQGTGVGLANVRRRLLLCFGPAGELTISSSNDVTTARFTVPGQSAPQRASP